MKRLLLAAALAFMVHGLFFAWAPRLSSQRPIERPKPITVTLSEPRAASPGLASKNDQPLSPIKAPVTKPESQETSAPVKENIPKKETARSPKEVASPKAAIPESRLSTRTEETPLKRKPIAPLKRETPKRKKESIPSPSTKREPPVEDASKSEARLEPVEPQGAAPAPAGAREGRSVDSLSDASGPTGAPNPPVGEEGPTSVPPDEPTVKAVPAYRDNPRPEYPRMAKRRGYEGTVLLEVLVDHTGKARDVRILNSSGYDVLDKSAMASVKQWLFEPGSVGGRKVDMWVRVPVRFELKQN